MSRMSVRMRNKAADRRVRLGTRLARSGKVRFGRELGRDLFLCIIEYVSTRLAVIAYTSSGLTGYQ